MRLGLAVPHYDSTVTGAAVAWEPILDIARRAEAGGFSSLWVSDHLFLDFSKYGAPDQRLGSFECWATLSALAASTSSLRLGTLTLCNEFRNPALVAKMAASLDFLSGGRLDLGLGAGWYEPEFHAAGLPWRSAGERIRRLEEAATITRRLLEGEELTWSGNHYRVDGAVVRPRSIQRPHPPIWIGGKGDLLLAAAARSADGWNWSWLGSIEAYRERAREASRACERIDRDPATLRRSVGAHVLVGRNDADLRRRWERLARATPTGVLRKICGGGPISLEAYGRIRFTGTAQRVAELVGSLEELGVEELVVSLGALPFQAAHPDDVEVVGGEIASALG
ncbi:MAG: LLM class flavin-dependent oxidoreductase [Actinobacteria bacterium]|nr:LLM class flavin-dependent oxidoreductase [Actinomycetota bacterium]